MDIWIKIRSIFESKGAQDATKGLNALSDAGNRAAPAMNKAAGAAKVSIEEFSRAARMASAAGGSIEGVGSVVQMLGTRIAGAAAAIPILGLAYAAFASWKLVIDTLIERHREQARLLRSIKDGNAVAGLDSITKAYERMSTALDRVTDKTHIMMDGQMEMLKVDQELNDAKLKAAETTELAAEKDPIKQDAIRARYAAAQQSGRSSTDANLQAMKVDRLKYDLSVNAEQMFDKRTKERDLRKLLASFSKAAMDPDRTPEEKKAAQENQAKASDDVIKINDELQQLDLNNVRLVDQLAVESKRTEVMRLTGSDAQTRQGWEIQKQDERVRVAEIEKQRTALEEQRAAAESQLAQVQERESSAQTYVDDSQSRIDAGTFNPQDNADVWQTLVAMREQRDLLQSVLASVRREQEKTNEILRTLPSAR